MTRALALLLATTVLGGCGIFGGGDDEVKETCHEPQAYQAEQLGDRIKSPDGLDQLEEFKEMPIPESETPPRAENAGCITRPPSIRAE